MAEAIVTLDPMWRGDYRVIEFVIDEPDPANPGSRRPRNITSDTFRFGAKKKLQETTPLFTKTSATGGGITKTVPASGKGEIEIFASDTATIAMSRDFSLECDLEGTPSGSPPKPYTTRFRLPLRLDVSY